MPSQRIVVLGNGGAAAHAVHAARSTHFTGEIHMISDSCEPAFNPMLAPYYLKGKLSWENCFPFGNSFYSEHDVTCHFGSPVEELDTRAQTVRTLSGEKIGYDMCLVATGASASIPPVPGLQGSPFAFPLRTSESTLKLEKILASARKVVILGASLVGLKIAEIMTRKNARITVVDTADQIMPRGAHPETAGLLQQYLETQEIQFLLGCSLQGIEEKDSGVCCFFPESIVNDADFIAVCTGIRPNLGFIDRDQVDVEIGIVVDKQSRSSSPVLYAAGDCAQGINFLTGRREWLGTWSNACYQGRAAGINMAGGRTTFEGYVPQHISPLFDWVYAQMGDVNPKGENVRVTSEGSPEHENGFRLCVYEDDVLIGVNLINRMNDLGALKQAVLIKK